MQGYLLILCLLSTLYLTESRYGGRRVLSPNYKAHSNQKYGAVQETICDPPCKEFWFEQQIDHFNFRAISPLTFQQRYLVSDTYWDGKGPVLFYTGNEGDADYFWNNTGWVTNTLAQSFNGLVVFGEHRYYGQSLPFGNSSFDGSNSQYLTSEQALADYARLIPYIKTLFNAQNSPVISFGGSYGGMLASWFRIKYPHVTIGAVASSAPVLQFYDTGASEWSFYQIVTQDFSECSAGIRQSFYDLIATGQTAEGLRNISKIFNLCHMLTHVNSLYYWIEAGFSYEAMIDYPYPTSFLEPVPANPCNVSCQVFLEDIAQGKSSLVALRDAVAVYYNSTGDVACYDLTHTADDSLGTKAWNYQACTEMVMPTSSNGTSDMFLESYWDEEGWENECLFFYGVDTRPNWITTNYGGTLNEDGTTNIEASNIVYLNGDLDPWSGGGVLKSLSDTVISIYMKGAAHHLDLRTPNAADPRDVVNGRQTVVNQMNNWISQFHSQQNQEHHIHLNA